MYAIVETGSKQYRAQKGDELSIELLNTKEGATLKLDKVLLIAGNGKTQIGKPYIGGAFVEAKVLKQMRAPKIISFKKIRREAGASTKIGHRQHQTKIKILSISDKA